MDVFDFDEDDEVNNSLAGKFSGKLPSPSSDDPLPRDSLQCDASGISVQMTEIVNVPYVDLDAADCNADCVNATLRTSPDKSEEKTGLMNEGFDNRLQGKPLCDEECDDFKSDHENSRNFVSDAQKRCLELKASSLLNAQLNCDDSDESESEPIDVTSDVVETLDEEMARSSSASPASETAEDDDVLNGYALDLCSGNVEMDDMNTTIVLYPDYAVYRATYCTGPQLTFSDSGIKITGSTACENQEAFDFECELDDVVNIESQFFHRVETVMIKLRVISNDVATHGTSGIEELKISIVEPNWCKKQEAITSLHLRYLSVWNHVQDTDVLSGTDEEDSPRLSHYFPVFEVSFEEVVYPKGDADAVSISKRDVDLLQPETFINDTLIDFYIKYLKNQIPPVERHKYHFFNSFFFRKLADLDKDPSSASDGAAAFQRVRKWTRKVDLFGKEFVFIPINFSLHWSLVVLCHPSEVATFTDEDLDRSLKVPCILHMDSIKGNHAGLKHLIQSYLWEEWKERKKETSEEVSSRFHNLRFVSLELPQQENSYDCGLFLLHYLERFVAEVTDNFNPFKLEKSSSFLNSNWFPPTEASLKRALIQRLIFELLKNRSQEVSSPVPSDDEVIPQSNVNGVGSQFLSASFNPGPSCQQNDLSTSHEGQGIELTLLSPSSMKNSQCVNDSDLVLRDLFNPAVSAGSLLEQCQSFDQKAQSYHHDGAMSTLEEDPETGEQFVYSETGFHQLQLSGITPQTGNVPCTAKEYASNTFGMGISLQTDCGDVEPSVYGSDDSSDVVAITETFPVVENLRPMQKEETDEQKSPSFVHVECVQQDLVSVSHEFADRRSPPLKSFKFVNEGLADSAKLPDTATAEASHNCGMSKIGNENGFSFPSFLEYCDVQVVSQDSAVAYGDVLMIEDNKVALNLPEQQPVDNMICSGESLQNMDDTLLSLGSLGCPATQIVDDDDFVGLDSRGQKQVDNEQFVVDGEVRLVMSLGDYTRIDQEDGSVSLDSQGHKPVSTATGFGNNTQIVDENGSVCLVSLGLNKVIVSVDDSEIFEDASAGLDSPGQKPVDNVIGSCDNSQIFEDALVGLDSPGQKSVDNNLGGNSPVFEDASMDLYPFRERSDIVINLDNDEVTEDCLAAPDSPGQNPAKRPRLSPSVEDETETAEN